MVRLAHGLTIIVVAALLCLPNLLVGIPKGDDGDLHVMYQHYFSEQFWHGDLYPVGSQKPTKAMAVPSFLYSIRFHISSLLFCAPSSPSPRGPCGKHTNWGILFSGACWRWPCRQVLVSQSLLSNSFHPCSNRLYLASICLCRSLLPGSPRRTGSFRLDASTLGPFATAPLRYALEMSLPSAASSRFS